MSKGPKPVQATKTKSNFAGINHYNLNLGGLGSSSTLRDPTTRAISTNTSLSPGLQGIQNNAVTGLSNNQSFLNQNPTQQYNDLQAGNNPFYNAQAAVNNENNQNSYNALQSRMSQSGMENSTTMGAMAGQQTRDNNLLDLATRAQALDQQNQLASNNLTLNSGLLNQLYGIQSGAGAQTSGQAMQGLGNADQVGMFNSQQQNQVALANQQAQQQAAASRNALIGNVIGTAGSLAAIPFTGGASSLGLLSALRGGAYGGMGSMGGGGLNNFGGLSSGSILSPLSYLGRTF